MTKDSHSFLSRFVCSNCSNVFYEFTALEVEPCSKCGATARMRTVEQYSCQCGSRFGEDHVPDGPYCLKGENEKERERQKRIKNKLEEEQQRKKDLWNRASQKDGK